MKLEELMTGDWILWKSDSPKNEFPVQVTLEMMQNELKKWNDRFRFIPITPKILERNGFKNITQKLESIEQYIHLYELSDDIVLGELPIGFNVCIEKYNGDWDIYEHHIVFTIRYVHELQHTLRLCKIDKEIKL